MASNKIFPEDLEAQALWSWSNCIPILREHLFHIPNGGKRNKIEAGRMKAMGVRAGVSDYNLPVPRGTFYGLWIELKPTKNYKSVVIESQREWILKMRAQGYAACVCYGWSHAREVLLWYLGLEVPDIKLIELEDLPNVGFKERKQRSK